MADLKIHFHNCEWFTDEEIVFIQDAKEYAEKYAKEQQLKLLKEIHKLCTSPYTVPIEFKIEQRIKQLIKELQVKDALQK